MKYNVLHCYEADVVSSENPYQFEQAELFEMALRVNKKRQFLFVSKLLGKHLAVHPTIPKLTSHLLAHRFMEVRFSYRSILAERIAHSIETSTNLTEMYEESYLKRFYCPTKAVVIGFAETATSLGHAFFEKFSGDTFFVHTTRENLQDVSPIITFEEEHSHASSHRIYGDISIFQNCEEFILVDDEITTGNTNCNIIEQLHEKFPEVKIFTLISILDFRSEEACEKMNELAQRLNITIHSISLFKATFTIEKLLEDIQEPHYERAPLLNSYSEFDFEHMMRNHIKMHESKNEFEQIQRANLLKYSGTMPISPLMNSYANEKAKEVAELLNNAREDKEACLVLGTGEFMYFPNEVAIQMGENVYYHSSTRSPIYAHPQSIIFNKIEFPSVEFPGVKNYLYNIPYNKYSTIFVLFERILDRKAAAILYSELKEYAEHVHIVTLGGGVYATSTR
jgi:hypothetical protein